MNSPDHLNAKENLTMPVTKDKTNNNEQFKATRLWNEILQAFYLGIELKRHRRQMKLYYDCFTASDAISWLKNYLKNNPEFNGNKITRFQALNLLKKYHKSNIIERINLDKNDLELKDNNELYRFTVEANENLPFLPTSKSEADLLKACSNEDFKPIELDVREKNEIYKKVLWSRLNRFMYNINDYVKLEKIDGNTVLNNVTRVNSNGVVQLIDKNEDLPQWILSAMKCLANWPITSGSGNCLPKYPGFEYDVFKLIREYFINMEEPMIPSHFYKLFIDVHELHLKAESLKRKKSPSFNQFSSIPSDEINQELGLPANCVYETVFSSKEPVTKIVPINEVSNLFPNFIDLFKNTNHSTSMNYNFHQIPSFSNCTSNTFHLLSTIPRSSTKRKIAHNATLKDSDISYLSSGRLTFASPPEKSEYMIDKNVSSQKFYSLRKNKSFKSCPKELFNQSHQSFYELIQLLLLLLPNANRRHLQLLIRLFSKIIGNRELCLLTKDSLALKEHILNTFTRCIIHTELEKDFNEFKSKEFVSFLIDECMNIFKIPEDFQSGVERMMNDFRDKKNRDIRLQRSNDYCQKISNEEYESQRDALSDVALSDLLQSIMGDESLSEKDKHKWIKQFKLYHPEVYDVYFTNCNVANKNSDISQKRLQQRAYSLGTQTITSIKQKRDFLKRFLSLKI